MKYWIDDDSWFDVMLNYGAISIVSFLNVNQNFLSFFPYRSLVTEDSASENGKITIYTTVVCEISLQK